MSTPTRLLSAVVALCSATLLGSCSIDLLNTRAAHELAQKAQPSGSVYTGWRVFQDKCASCHGPAGLGTAAAPNLLPKVRDIGPRQARKQNKPESTSTAFPPEPRQPARRASRTASRLVTGRGSRRHRPRFAREFRPARAPSPEGRRSRRPWFHPAPPPSTPRRPSPCGASRPTSSTAARGSVIVRERRRARRPR